MEQTDDIAVAGRTDPGKSGFRSLDHSAADIILAVAFNFQGTRIALCSADHRIQVFSIDSDDVWTSIDQWRGHDAEILDASSPLVALKTPC